MILGLETLNLRRNAATVWAAGRGTSTPTASTFQGSWQPLSGREIALLPEGERATNYAKVYTETALNTSDQHTKVSADLISRDGSAWFKVLTSVPYFTNAPIPHYKALAKRAQEADE